MLPLPFPAPPFEFIDLSALTSFLVDEIDTAVQNSPMWTPANPRPPITVSGSSPDSVRANAGCQLTFYLFHIDQDPHYRNAPVMGPRAVPIPFQPLSLNLYYLLTSFAADNATQEQQTMSIALRWIHEHPVFSTVAGANHFTLTMQPESADDLGRLWQSMTTSARLSAVYRVAVVFVAAPAPIARPQPVEVFNLVVDPATLPFAPEGEVLGTERRFTYRTPDAGAPRSVVRSPAIVAPGQRFHLWGSHLGLPPSEHLYLLSADGSTEQDVSAWVVQPSVDVDRDGNRGARLTVRLPATMGTPPADSPPAGIYQFRVGRDTPLRYRSNATPFSIAPSVTGPTTPQLFLAPAAGTFTVPGTGFDNAAAEVLLGTVPLNRRQPGDAIADGDFLAAADASSIAFRLPPSLPSGDYPVRIRVNNVEADPAWWVHA